MENSEQPSVDQLIDDYISFMEKNLPKIVEEPNKETKEELGVSIINENNERIVKIAPKLLNFNGAYELLLEDNFAIKETKIYKFISAIYKYYIILKQETNKKLDGIHDNRTFDKIKLFLKYPTTIKDKLKDNCYGMSLNMVFSWLNGKLKKKITEQEKNKLNEKSKNLIEEGKNTIKSKIETDLNKLLKACNEKKFIPENTTVKVSLEELTNNEIEVLDEFVEHKSKTLLNYLQNIEEKREYFVEEYIGFKNCLQEYKNSKNNKTLTLIELPQLDTSNFKNKKFDNNIKKSETKKNIKSNSKLEIKNDKNSNPNKKGGVINFFKALFSRKS